MKELKKQLRKEIREEKKRHSADELMALSSALLEQIEQHPRFIASDTILMYHSLSDEVQTHAFVDKWHTTKKVLLPVVQGDIMVLRHYTGKSCLQQGSFGIEEPGGEDFTAYHEIDLGIIPGMSFDHQGNRLGRGKGYYDKDLSRAGFRATKIGICYKEQLAEDIPSEPHDIVMDCVIFG